MSNTQMKELEDVEEKKYLRDFNYSIELYRLISRSIGTWPKSNIVTTTMTKILVLVMLGFIIIPSMIFVILEVDNTYEQIRFMGPITFFLMVTLKYVFMINHESNMIRCLRNMEIDWKHTENCDKERTIMLRYANLGRKLVVVCFCFMYAGGSFFYFLVPMKIGRIFDETINRTYLPLVYPVPSIMFDTKQTPTNEILFSFQCTAGYLAHNITIAACGLAAVLAAHACGQMAVLRIRLENLMDDHPRDADRRLSSIVQHHVDILK